VNIIWTSTGIDGIDGRVFYGIDRILVAAASSEKMYKTEVVAEYI
jgi:hypothetical protein